uniref:Uncharacterized protein n=1 Tax=viral metagenome TaxID=1070528 RepID=A0A6M3IUJ3_9ZZZZ
MEYRVIRNVNHYIFDSEDEFNKHFKKDEFGNIPIVQSEWRVAQKGAWVWSDDGRIVQILYRGKISDTSRLPNPAKHYIRTVVGTFMCRPNWTMDTDFRKHVNRYTLSGNCNVYMRKTRDRLSKKELQWIALMRLGHSPLKAYKLAFPKAKDDFHIATTVTSLLQYKRIVNEMNKQAQEAAKKLGMDEEYVLKQHKRIIEEESSAKNVISSLQEVSKIIQIYPEERPNRGFLGHSTDYEEITEGELTQAQIGLVKQEEKENEV